MAEYKSFHYLMHSTPESVQAHFTSGPQPLTFEELYSPRERSQIYKGEKSYWRTRDRIEFTIYEDRAARVLIVTCRNMEKDEYYRTIFLNMAQLYFEVESKAQGVRELLTKKKNKKLDGADLYKATSEFILARLFIKKDAIPWPVFNSPRQENPDTTVPSATVEGADTAAAESTVATSENSAGVHTERMCTFEKLSGDEFEDMEVSCPIELNLDGLPYVKITPAVSQDQPEREATTTSSANPSTSQPGNVASSSGATDAVTSTSGPDSSANDGTAVSIPKETTKPATTAATSDKSRSPKKLSGKGGAPIAPAGQGVSTSKKGSTVGRGKKVVPKG